MATEVIMPRLAAEMEEGTVSVWLKAEGEYVQKGEPLFHVESEKANVEMEAPASGVLRAVHVPAGSAARCGALLAVIAEPEEVVQAAQPLTPLDGDGIEPQGLPEAAGEPGEQRAPHRTTPAARRLARELKVELVEVRGTGPGGRIVEEDVRAYVRSRAGRQTVIAAAGAQVALDEELAPTTASKPLTLGPAAVPARDEAASPSPLVAGNVDLVPLSRLRRVTGERMVESIHRAPHFALSVDVDMSEAGRLRGRWRHPGRPDAGSLSYTALLVCSTAKALARHPMVNATLHDGQLRLLREVNVGVATAVKEGLIVPVIRNADRRGLADLADALEALRRRAEGMAFRPEDLTGGTFTVSNLGMYGVDWFTAIINPPESAILAVGRIVRRAVVVGDEIAVRPMVTVTLSVDHRVLDGATAAAFLSDVREMLENPYLLI